MHPHSALSIRRHARSRPAPSGLPAGWLVCATAVLFLALWMLAASASFADTAHQLSAPPDARSDATDLDDDHKNRCDDALAVTFVVPRPTYAGEHGRDNVRSITSPS